MYHIINLSTCVKQNLCAKKEKEKEKKTIIILVTHEYSWHSNCFDNTWLIIIFFFSFHVFITYAYFIHLGQAQNKKTTWINWDVRPNEKDKFWCRQKFPLILNHRAACTTLDTVTAVWGVIMTFNHNPHCKGSHPSSHPILPGHPYLIALEKKSHQVWIHSLQESQHWILTHSIAVEHLLSALLQLHLHSGLNTWLQWIGQRELQNERRNIWVWGFRAPYVRDLMVTVKQCKLEVSDVSYIQEVNLCFW